MPQLREMQVRHRLAQLFAQPARCVFHGDEYLHRAGGRRGPGRRLEAGRRMRCFGRRPDGLGAGGVSASAAEHYSTGCVVGPSWRRIVSSCS
jgi:hypothetical protein